MIPQIFIVAMVPDDSSAQGHKTSIMLNSTEHEIHHAHNDKMPTIVENCWHFNIY